MHGDAQFDHDDDAMVFRDVIMLALLGFVTIVILLLPHLNPPVQATESVRQPGNVVVEVRWPDELDTDVDLWVEAPGDVPVGYSNKGGRIFNLLRDDLGQQGDAAQRNYEFAFSRGAPAGEYTVNLHLYRNDSERLPISAVVTVSILTDAERGATSIATEKVELVRAGEELTVVRFSLDEAGNLVPGSRHRLQRGLRSASR
jgi:hypothetical protein